MKLSPQKLALALALSLVSATPALAQYYPFPGKSTNAPVNCTSQCLGNNYSGQANAGLPTWPYSTPMVNHVGRICDSTEVTDFQGGTGFATARARIVKLSRDTHGAAPPRAYIQLGSAIAVYSLDKFFTTELPGGITAISAVIQKTVPRGDYPNEKVLKWDAWVFPENPSSGWQTTYSDGQDKLFDFDVDDRGYIYVGTGGFFGWGLVLDGGQTGGSLLQLVSGSQFYGERMNVSVGGRTLTFAPDHIMAVKTNGKYYSVVSSSETGRAVYDVSSPSAGELFTYKSGVEKAFQAYAKDEIRGRIAIVTMTRNIEIYDASAFVAGGAPIASFTAPSGKYYRDVTVDESGNFWTSETSNSPTNNKVVKLERATSGYDRQTFDVYGEPFSPQAGASEGLMTINYGDKYLAVTGRGGTGGGSDTDVKVFRIEGGEPVPVSVGNFFNKYYHKAPRDYAQPRTNVSRIMGAYPIKWNNKQYLIYNAQGLGDVYELQAGDSINVAQKSGIFGTTNPHAKSTSPGPYYGDLMKFSAASSSQTQYALTWDFDNTDSGLDNSVSGTTGQDGEHQFSGLNTAAEIETVRHVKATADVNAEVNGTVNVTLKVPTARIGIAGTNTVVTADDGTLDIVAGDQLSDASDGTVQGHYSAWTLDSTSSNQNPDVPLAVTEVGPHTVTLAAKYGKYNSDHVTNGAAYTDTVSNLAVTVRPFAISFVDPTVSGSTVTFKGSARVTADTSVYSASTWTVEWTLKDGATDVVPPQTTTDANVGTIPNFQAPDRSAIPSGSILQLKVTAPTGLGTSVPSQYGTQTITQTLLTPDPKINKSGCTNVGQPCSFTIASSHNPPNPTTDWTVTWTLRFGTTSMGTAVLSAGQTYTPTITTPGNYTVSAVATTKLFEGTASDVPFTMGGTICGPLPSSSDIAIYFSPDAPDVNTNVSFQPDSFTYTFEDCESYIWDFGDGSGPQPATTQFRVTHKYTTKKSYTVKLNIKKGTALSPTYTTTVRVGGDVVNPCAGQTAPSNIEIQYLGNKNCSTGQACKTTERMTFYASRGTGPLQACDSTEWTFSNGGTSNAISPSQTFSTPGPYTATVVVSNSLGQASKSINFTIVEDGGSCLPPANSDQVYISWVGATSGCSDLNGKVCVGNESIKFTVRPYLGGGLQACDKFEWNFGDSTGSSTAAEPTHQFVGNVPSYHVALRLYNTANSTGNIIAADVPFPASIKPLPHLSYASTFPSTGTKGNAVSFTVTSDIPATGWNWNFGDGPSDTSQATAVGTTNTITHVFTTTGVHKVIVKARNADDVANAQTAQVDRDITIDETPEYRYLVPVAAHAGGNAGSVWRTDIQIYTSDATVSSENPLLVTVTFKGHDYPRYMYKSTVIMPDILGDLLGPQVTEQGSLIISVKTQKALQIWSRTYNQTADGTFGQFVPAVLLDTAGGGSAVGDGAYFLAGLKNDGRYRTNVGLVNPNAQEITANVQVYDEHGFPAGAAVPHRLQPFALEQFPVTGPDTKPFSIQIEIPAGAWLYAYASLIDGGSNDPIFLSAVRESELNATENRENVIPGVGHVQAWRSDVTLYNPPGLPIAVDVAYYDAGGSKVGQATIPINANQTIQYEDLLKQGVLGNIGDGVGTLRITTAGSPNHFPLTFARTYNDNSSGKTYGQGIAGFAASSANVRPGKPGLVPAVRDDSDYYTNIGLTNVSSVVTTVLVKVLDPITGQEVAVSAPYVLQPNQSIVGRQDLAGRSSASLRIEAAGGNVWAFASIIDEHTFDPEYVPATPLP